LYPFNVHTDVINGEIHRGLGAGGRGTDANRGQIGQIGRCGGDAECHVGAKKVLKAKEMIPVGVHDICWVANEQMP